ncbi:MULTISPECIES: Atu4866 domain-containing protein [Rhodococcus]|uniref:Atu4866 domain-containing protein n=1 Tax=Rhodococcus TaxID=1827 RepID=UPI002078549E|nr:MULTISPECIES: Atu4866 domain-containing protein [Rhodococcus]MCT7293596.1 Atu4866 domain-containing protein [Rhodococcus sp. PAE-6]USI90206.1 Atu4866 domain-containing protein [Rhodococcus pyridinivorans]
MTIPFTPELFELIRENAGGHRPLLFGNARIITGDSLIGDFDRGDVLLGGSRVVGIGPGLLTAADDDGAIVIDCAGYVIVPAIVDVIRLRGLRPTSFRSPSALAPGNPATFAILPVSRDDSETDVLQRFIDDADAAHTVVVDGEIALWGGRSVHADDPTETPTATDVASDRHLGTWIDETDFVHQHLTADGRYDETRGGRPHAYQGSYRITGDRIDYRDDLGFWAFGEFVDGTLQHAGYTFHRA